MADYTVSIQRYSGNLLGTDLISLPRTIVLGGFGAMTNGATLSDSSGQATLGETLTVNGTPFQVIGSGSVQPGITVFGLTVFTGTAVPVVLVRSPTTGYHHFIYPEGGPNLTGALFLVTDFDPIGYDLNTGGPLCFLAGTAILTPDGPRPVEAMRAGDHVLDLAGRPQRVLEIARCRIDARQANLERNRPVQIRKDSLGPGLPARDLILSPQHRLLLQGAGNWRRLAPAKALLRKGAVERPPWQGEIDYFHIICADHVLLRAEGVAAETLFLGKYARGTDWAGRLRTPRDIHAGMRPAAPLLTVQQARRLMQQAQDKNTRYEPMYRNRGGDGEGDATPERKPPRQNADAAHHMPRNHRRRLGSGPIDCDLAR